MKRSIYWGIAILNAIGAVVYLLGVEASVVPTHYNIAGEIDAYGSKWSYLILVFLPILLLLAFEIYRRRTKGSPRVMKNRKLEDLLIPAVALVYVGVCWATLLPLRFPGEGMGSRMGALVIFLLGILMIFISNYMGKIQPNRTLGIRCKWTLSDDEVWRVTHRFGAISGTIGGLVIAIFAAIGFFTTNAFVFAIIGLILGLFFVSLLPILYAKKCYDRRHPR